MGVTPWTRWTSSPSSSLAPRPSTRARLAGRMPTGTLLTRARGARARLARGAGEQTRGIEALSTRVAAARSCGRARVAVTARCDAKDARVDAGAVARRARAVDSVDDARDGWWVGRAAAAASGLALAAAPEAANAAMEATRVATEVDDGGFLQGLLLILFSEIGDKTFFIAVLLATQADKKAVFAGTYGALAVMTLISVALGGVLHQADEAITFQSSIPWDDVIAAALLLYFGVTTIQKADGAEESAEEEEADAKDAVDGLLSGSFSGEMALVASTFGVVFAAEWGDKSFFATIALAAAADPGAVTAGALAGHFIATAGAVVLGDVVSEKLSEKVVAYVGGSLFILFALGTGIDIVQKVTGV